MINVNFFLSTDISISVGELKRINFHIEDLRSTNPTILVDSNLVDNDYLNEILDIIKATYKNINIYINDLGSEPTYSYLEEKKKEISKNNPDLIIAIGGGSTMDIGKGVSLLITNNRPALDLKGFPLNVNDPLPLITIPSVFGSGSEVSYNAVFIDEDEGKKLGINSRKNFPKKSLIDPLLTMSAPNHVIVSSALDSLVHCVDSFGSINSNMFSNIFAIEGFNKSFNTLLDDDLNLAENRINLAVGSICGIIALMNSGDGPTNGFAYYFGVKNKIPHGLAGGMFLKDVMRWNYDNGFTKYDNFLLSSGENSDTLFTKMEKLYINFKIPRLADFGYINDDIDNLASKVSIALDGSFSGNPITFNEQSAKEIIKKQIN